MYINISYINMCRFNKNREWRKEWERGVSGDNVCGLILFAHLSKYNMLKLSGVGTVYSSGATE
jgi:hypothetical protein